MLGSYELGKANWGWSWKERWIAARPWESRVASSTSPKKTQNKLSFKVQKNKSTSTSKTSVSVTPTSSSAKGTPPLGNAKGSAKPRRLSYPTTTEKSVVVEGGAK